jgi:hypothetical protein
MSGVLISDEDELLIPAPFKLANLEEGLDFFIGVFISLVCFSLPLLCPLVLESWHSSPLTSVVRNYS